MTNQSESPYINIISSSNCEIIKYNIIYFNQSYEYKSYEIQDLFEKLLLNFHNSRYVQKSSIIIENLNSTTIIKYITQFVSYIVTIERDTSVLMPFNANSITITISLKKMLCITCFSDDYSKLIVLTKDMNDRIINENKEQNDDIYNYRQELCQIEYVMDHC